MAAWTESLQRAVAFIIILVLVDLDAIHGDDLVALLQGALLMRRTSRNLSDDEISKCESGGEFNFAPPRCR